MDRKISILLATVLFVFFLYVSYRKVMLNSFSTVALSTFLSIIVLNVFYSPHRLAIDEVDFTIMVYAIYQLLAVSILSLYVMKKCLEDVRVL